jgi:hypothetical protein
MTLISTATELRYSDFYGSMSYSDFLKYEADVKAGRKTSDTLTTSETTWN